MQPVKFTTADCHVSTNSFCTSRQTLAYNQYDSSDAAETRGLAMRLPLTPRVREVTRKSFFCPKQPNENRTTLSENGSVFISAPKQGGWEETFSATDQCPPTLPTSQNK